jgi:D-alanine-D-alanine ligase
MDPVPSTIRVAVLFGGRSGEHDVSCRSAAGVMAELDRRRYDVLPVRITADGVWIVGSEDPGVARGADATAMGPDGGRPTAAAGLPAAVEALGDVDVVFPCLHGPYGEDGTVQGLLELAGVPYVGSGVAASAVGMDKELTKRVLAAEGIVVADGIVLRGPDDTVGHGDRDRLGLPVFVKPARAGSSIGVSRVERWEDLDSAIARARRRDTKVLVETALAGPEIDVAVLERPDGSLTTGPPLKIRVGSGRTFFDFDAKYADATTTFEIPACLGAATADQLAALSLRTFRALDCTGLLRVDFLLHHVDGALIPVVNEVNTMPGFTAASQYPRIWQAAGTDYPELLDILIQTALARRR